MANWATACCPIGPAARFDTLPEDKHVTYQDDDSYDDEHWKIQNHINTAACPNCKKTIYDDTPRCPFCGEYITSRQLLGGGGTVKFIGIALLFLALAMFIISWLFSPPW